MASSIPCFLFLILFCNIFEIGLTRGRKISANMLRHHTRRIVNQTTIQTFGSNIDL